MQQQQYKAHKAKESEYEEVCTPCFVAEITIMIDRDFGVLETLDLIENKLRIIFSYYKIVNKYEFAENLRFMSLSPDTPVTLGEITGRQEFRATVKNIQTQIGAELFGSEPIINKSF